MILLGVDPGTLVTGFGVVECRAGAAPKHVDHGCIRTQPKAPLWQRLRYIHDAIAAVALKYQPDALSLERVFVSKNVQSALKLGHTRGAIMIACGEMPVHEYTPGQIKSAVTGNGRADKHQVAEMVRIILGLPKAAPSDASDALAAAICHSRGVTVATLRPVVRAR